jgi:hypothetical protein
MYAFIALILDDHVVHNHASSHHLLHHLCASCPSKVLNNNPPRLEHTKCTLHILPACLLSLGKPSIFLLRWFTNYFYKSRPLEIDTISKIVAFVVWMASASLAKTGDRWSTLMPLWEPTMPKKSVKSIGLVMPRPQEWQCTPRHAHYSAIALQMGSSSTPNACNQYFLSSLIFFLQIVINFSSFWDWFSQQALRYTTY